MVDRHRPGPIDAAGLAAFTWAWPPPPPDRPTLNLSGGRPLSVAKGATTVRARRAADQGELGMNTSRTSTVP